MPDTRIPATELGEAALLQMTLRATDHERLSRLDREADPIAGRHAQLQFGHLRHENALVDLVAVAENFTSRRLLELRPQVSEYQVFTWAKRREAWARHGPVDLTTITPHWLALLGFVEARNALQHGLGRLTNSQLRPKWRQETLDRIKAARIFLSGDIVQIGEDTVINCRTVCEDYVLALDKEAPPA